jgi:hypothetical protein
MAAARGAVMSIDGPGPSFSNELSAPSRNLLSPLMATVSEVCRIVHPFAADEPLRPFLAARIDSTR